MFTHRAPDTAPALRPALLLGLEELEAELQCHAHKEKNVLFPLALVTAGGA